MAIHDEPINTTYNVSPSARSVVPNETSFRPYIEKLTDTACYHCRNNTYLAAMGEPETTHEMRLAGSDLEACRRFCRQHDVRWSVLCKLGWVIANGIYRGEPGVPTGALERHTNANGQPTILFETLQIDFDSTSLLSQVLESMNHRRLDGISSSSASAVVNEIAQMPNHGDKLVAITDTPDDEISLEVLRRSLTTDTLVGRRSVLCCALQRADRFCVI